MAEDPDQLRREHII